MHQQPNVSVDEYASGYRRRVRRSSIRRVGVRETGESRGVAISKLFIQTTTGRNSYRDQSRDYDIKRSVSLIIFIFLFSSINFRSIRRIFPTKQNFVRKGTIRDQSRDYYFKSFRISNYFCISCTIFSPIEFSTKQNCKGTQGLLF